ncbi:MAG TPA: hypothetical protein IAB21_03290 [Candidatus Avelusimicrobium excrementipullorum]|nr:hypothetical protein [Candidatus Avelusimicrobium excrementipullorum]
MKFTPTWYKSDFVDVPTFQELDDMTGKVFDPYGNYIGPKERPDLQLVVDGVNGRQYFAPKEYDDDAVKYALAKFGKTFSPKEWWGMVHDPFLTTGEKISVAYLEMLKQGGKFLASAPTELVAGVSGVIDAAGIDAGNLLKALNPVAYFASNVARKGIKATAQDYVDLFKNIKTPAGQMGETAALYRASAQNWEKTLDKYLPDVDDNIKAHSTLVTISSMAGQVGGSLLLAAATSSVGGLASVAGAFGSQQFYQLREEYLEKGYSLQSANIFAGMGALAEGGLEAAGFNKWLKYATLKPSLRNHLIAGFMEASQEAAQTTAEEALTNLTGVRQETLTEILAQIAISAVAGFIPGAGLSLMGGGIGIRREKAVYELDRAAERTPIAQEQRAQLTQQTQAAEQQGTAGQTAPEQTPAALQEELKKAKANKGSNPLYETVRNIANSYGVIDEKAIDAFYAFARNQRVQGALGEELLEGLGKQIVAYNEQLLRMDKASDEENKKAAAAISYHLSEEAVNKFRENTKAAAQKIGLDETTAEVVAESESRIYQHLSQEFGEDLQQLKAVEILVPSATDEQAPTAEEILAEAQTIDGQIEALKKLSGADNQVRRLEQEKGRLLSRGSIELGKTVNKITLSRFSDGTTIKHELMHHWTDIVDLMAARGNKKAQRLRQTMDKIAGDNAAYVAQDVQNARQRRAEAITEAYEAWLYSGMETANRGEQSLFNAIKRYFQSIYRSVQEITGIRINPEIDRFFKQMTGVERIADADNPNIYFQTAYHGSPHEFTRFSTDAIGTGEGAQAHGWGLYFAQNRDVSEGYKSRLAERKANRPSREGGFWLGEERWGQSDVSPKAPYYVGKFLKDVYGNTVAVSEEEYNAAYEKAKQEYEELIKKGQVYEVDIPENDVLLDEDKTFDEQPEKVQDGLLAIAKDGRGPWADVDMMYEDLQEATGWDIYHKLADFFAEDMDDDWNMGHSESGSEAASKLLNEYGIKGITYDGAQDGRGYVIFDDKAIEVLNTFYQRGRAGGEDMFTPDAQTAQRFKAEVQTVLSDTNISNRQQIEMGRVPPLYVELGLPPQDLKTNKLALRKALGLLSQEELKVHKDWHNHNVPRAVVDDLLRLLTDPVAVFKSNTKQGVYVAVLDAEVQGKPVLAILSPNTRSDGYTFIPTIYEKDNFKNFVNTNAINRNILYADIKRTSLAGPLLQAGIIANNVPVNSIRTKEDFVKPENLKQDESVLREKEQADKRQLYQTMRAQQTGAQAADNRPSDEQIEKDLAAIRANGIEKYERESRIGFSLGNFAKNIVLTIRQRAGAVDKRLKAFFDKLDYFEANIEQFFASQTQGFFKKYKALSETDKDLFDYYAYNQLTERLRAFVKEKGMEKEYQQVRHVLDFIYAVSNRAGIDMGYIEEYFPTSLVDYAGFMDHMRGTDKWTYIEISLREKDPDGLMSEKERADAVNKIIRGYNRTAPVSKPGGAKERKILYKSPELMRFYERSDKALMKYLSSMGRAIAINRAYGKGMGFNTDETIGAIVLDLINTGTITRAEETEIKNLLKSRLSYSNTPAFVVFTKNIGYLQTMNNFTSAITQLGDLYAPIYKYGFSTAIEAMFGKTEITRKDLGLDKIWEEFSDKSKTGAAVDKLFKVIGLNAMDGFGKKVAINASLINLRKQAQAGSEALLERLSYTFGKEAGTVLKDIKAGRVTTNVKILAWADLADTQPIGKSGMPAAYWNNPHGRLFYQLKTYTTNQMSLFYADCLLNIGRGIQHRDKKMFLKGVQNLFKLMILLTAGNATGDVLKNLIMGRHIDVSDVVVSNLLWNIGLSKYTFYQGKRMGYATALWNSFVLPPMLSSFDSMYREVGQLAKGKKELKDTYAVTYFPFGRAYYWWFGGGRTQEREDAKERR